MRLWLVIAFWSLVGIAQADTLSGRVVAVHDGDTTTVLDANLTQHKIWMAGIDAPELRQAFGSRLKQNLSNLVYNRQVTVIWQKYDHYGRTVGVVLVDGHDVNLKQVLAGMAWWYRQYARDQSPAERRLYETAENDARTAKRGLWVDVNPVPPWRWRRR